MSVSSLLMRADSHSTGGLEGPPSRSRYYSCAQQRRCTTPFETNYRCFRDGIQRITHLRRDGHLSLPVRIQFVRLSPWSASQKFPGLILVLSCRRNRELWGADAYEFRPERWLDASAKPESPVGVYNNLCVARSRTHYPSLPRTEIC